MSRGIRGVVPVCHTEMARWIVENGLTITGVAKKLGISRTSVQKHARGAGISKPLSRFYRSFFPGIPVPIKGSCQVFEHPLPIRHMPITPADLPRSWTDGRTLHRPRRGHAAPATGPAAPAQDQLES